MDAISTVWADDRPPGRSCRVTAAVYAGKGLEFRRLPSGRQGKRLEISVSFTLIKALDLEFAGKYADF